ncbi:hypothetical protein KDK_16870 [Dictyobacter kobayashii]|uniref:Uncharacterized protein n=1 Tax=Dictyobacter kobayashii TaxID=2014872 RepID=A0A402AFJ6_9CHLR|nr:hypothetical protein KDK_16870 [Dictyobacter kobayashii]
MQRKQAVFGELIIKCILHIGFMVGLIVDGQTLIKPGWDITLGSLMKDQVC